MLPQKWIQNGRMSPVQDDIPDQENHPKEMKNKIVSFYVIVAATVIGHGLAIALSTKGSLFPGEDVMLSIIGTCAQIIAGLYGITMASYTFFLSRIDALTAQDTTLDYIVASLKKRFKMLIWCITVNVLVVLFVSIILMYCPVPSEDDHVFFYRLFCNEFVISMVFSIVLILYYSILVIDPNAVEKEAKKLKKRISHSLIPTGSVTEFISLYDRIENQCNSLLSQTVLNQIHENKGKHFELSIELLKVQHPTLLPLIPDLNRVHRYYECTVNCTPMTVTREMCQLAAQVLAYLQEFSSKVPH